MQAADSTPVGKVYGHGGCIGGDAACVVISPWEYRHLRGWAQMRIAGGVALTGLGLVTLAFGGSDWKTYGWAMAFLAAAVANLAFAYWELRIARSEATEPERKEGASRHD